jgi:hypothetical protein
MRTHRQERGNTRLASRASAIAYGSFSGSTRGVLTHRGSLQESHVDEEVSDKRDGSQHPAAGVRRSVVQEEWINTDGGGGLGSRRKRVGSTPPDTAS